MFSSLPELKEFCEQQEVKMIDFKVVDLEGRWHHLTIPYARLNQKLLEDGIGFDGSSYGFLTVEKSDMVFIPDISTSFLEPFYEHKTLSMIGDIYTLQGERVRYEGDPRYIAEKASSYLKGTGIADSNIIGPEFEFYMLDHVSFENKPNHMEVTLDSINAEWNSNNKDYNLGTTVPHKGGYHVSIPKDSSHDLRSEMCILLEENGIPVKYHHPEVGGPGQVEIEVELGEMLPMADKTMLLKHIVKNLAVQNGKVATFMPKPFYGEAGNGMHVHMQLFKEGKPLFYDEKGYSGLSEIALYYIGGLLKHAKALSAIANPSTNSYKRLVPGYEAPVSVCFATANRSAVIRIPAYATRPEDKRFEYRPSDATANPYLLYSALLMAGLDGIENKIDPTENGFGPFDFNIFGLSEEERSKIGALPKNLLEAADALDEDMDFLLKGGVFTKEILNNLIRMIRRDHYKVNVMPHPEEFKMYFDL